MLILQVLEPPESQTLDDRGVARTVGIGLTVYILDQLGPAAIGATFLQIQRAPSFVLKFSSVFRSKLA